MDKGLHETEISTVTVLRSSAAERNKQAILEVLKTLVSDEPIFALEIASGEPYI